MFHSTPLSDDSQEGLPALRRAIGHLAGLCSLDLACPLTLRQCLDGNFPPEGVPTATTARLEELRAMIVLLYRLENCCSEDLGFSGMQRLWQQHREILSAFGSREGHAPEAGADCCRA